MVLESLFASLNPAKGKRFETAKDAEYRNIRRGVKAFTSRFKRNILTRILGYQMKTEAETIKVIRDMSLAEDNESAQSVLRTLCADTVYYATFLGNHGHFGLRKLVNPDGEVRYTPRFSQFNGL